MIIYTVTRRICQIYGTAKSNLDEPTVQPFTFYITARFLLSPRNKSRKIIFASKYYEPITDQYDVENSQIEHWAKNTVVQTWKSYHVATIHKTSSMKVRKYSETTVQYSTVNIE